MWRLTIFKRRRQGFALIFVILLALAMIIPAVMIASSAAPRRKAVTGEAVSDRVLSAADGAVEMILNRINEFPKIISSDPNVESGINGINTYYDNNYYSKGDNPNPLWEPNRVAVKYTIAYILSKVNGGKPYQPDGTEDPAPKVGADYEDYGAAKNDSSFTDWDHSLWDIEDNVAVYLYDLKENKYYAVWDETNGCIRGATPSDTLSLDDPNFTYLNTYKIKDLSSETSSPVTIASIDPNFASDNRWVEIDANTQYIDTGDPTDDPETKFQIRATAYLLSDKTSVKHIQRTILAEAGRNGIEASSSSTSSGGSSTPRVSPCFTHAVWSGDDWTIANGNIKFEAADINPDGSYTISHTGGDLYGHGNITLNGLVKVNGSVITSKPQSTNPIHTNGAVTIKEGEKYGVDEDTPDFEAGTEDNVKETAQSHGVHPGDFMTNGNSTLYVNGIDVKYYIGGSATLNGDTTINFYPVDNNASSDGNPKVDWYVDGDLILNGDNIINFGSEPGIIWVNGDVILNGRTTINGSGTIVANKSITFNGMGDLKYASDKDMCAFISEGDEWNGGITINGSSDLDAIIYAPHSSVICNGMGRIFGTVVGGKGVIMNGLNKFIFDNRLANGSGGGATPPIPGSSSSSVESTSFNAPSIYRISWKEQISDPVIPSNISKLNPVVKFVPPSSP